MRRIPPVLAAAAVTLAAALGLLTSRSNDAGAAPPAVPAVLHADPVRPGHALHVTGHLDNAPAAVKLQVQTPDGGLRGPYGPFDVSGDRIDATLPAAATTGLKPSKDTSYAITLGLDALPASATETSQAAAATRTAS